VCVYKLLLSEHSFIHLRASHTNCCIFFFLQDMKRVLRLVCDFFCRLFQRWYNNIEIHRVNKVPTLSKSYFAVTKQRLQEVHCCDSNKIQTCKCCKLFYVYDLNMFEHVNIHCEKDKIHYIQFDEYAEID
jgi:hypothetical protein